MSATPIGRSAGSLHLAPAPRLHRGYKFLTVLRSDEQTSPLPECTPLYLSIQSTIRTALTMGKIPPPGSISTFATGLSLPFGLAFDTSDNLYVSDTDRTISRITPSGSRTTFASGLQIPNGL